MIGKLISIILDYSVHSIEIHSNPPAEPVGLSQSVKEHSTRLSRNSIN